MSTKGRERLRTLTAADLASAVTAVALFAVAPFALRRWGLGRVQRRLAAVRRGSLSLTDETRAGDDGTRTREVARRVSRLTEAVARRLPWTPNCLERSLVLWWLLRQQNVTTDLRIGARRVKTVDTDSPSATDARGRRPALSGTMAFHAWIELDGMVLNDRSDVREIYATFDQAIVPDDPTWT